MQNLHARFHDRGMKGFYWACFYGSKDIAKLILDFSQENDSIDLNASDYKGSNAFHMA